MGRHILICDCDNPLPSHLLPHKVILKSGTMTRAAQVVGNIREKARIHGVWLQLGELLKDIAFPEKLAAIPLYIELPGLGKFQEWHEQLSFLRDRNVSFC